MKNFKYWHLCLVLLLCVGCLSCAQNNANYKIKDDEKLIAFKTDEFTLPNLHVTPDGKNIIFDVLGDIYQVPIEGGNAKLILQDNNWNRGAKLSPDGKTLAYISDETGMFQVWTINLKTRKKRVYPIKETFHYALNAYWKDDEHLLIPSKDGLRNFDVRTGTSTILRQAKEEEKNIMHATNHKMTVNKTSTNAYYHMDGGLWTYDLNESVDKYIGKIEENRRKTLVMISPNGQNALYFGVSSEEPNIIELKHWNLETNTVKSIYETSDLDFFTNLDFSFDFIDDSSIVLDKEGEIIRLNIATGVHNLIPIEVEVKKVIKKPLRREPQYIKDSIITASVLRKPVTQSDMDTIYFGAFGKLHSYAKTTDEINEMFSKKDRFEVSPSLSPDGKYLAYTTWNDTEMGHVYAREINSGKEYQLTNTPGRYINPAWSPNGKELVFVADETEAKMGIPRQSGGRNTHNNHLDLHRIKIKENAEIQEKVKSDTIYKVYPFSILPRRFYPVPVFHTSGKSVFITTRNHAKNLPALIQIELETKEVFNEKLIPFHTDEVLVSPDSRHIAFIFDEQVWVDSFPHALKIEISDEDKYRKIEGTVDNILLPRAKSVYEIAPSYLSWLDENILMWGSAEEVYTYDVQNGKTEKIAEIKVRKSRAIPKTQYALTNARIITMNKEEEIIEKGTILVKDNRIEVVGKAEKIVIPENYKILNLEGKTIIPGLIDVHAHYHHNPFEFTNQQDFQYVGNLAYGVTTIYDPSVNVLDYRERAQMVETGLILGPRVFASGNIIMNHKMNYDYKNIEGIIESDRLMHSFSKLNTHGPIKEYDNRYRVNRRHLRSSAKSFNLTITAHPGAHIESITRIIDGYTAIEHELSSSKLNNDLKNLIAKSKVNYTPTLIVSPGINRTFVDNSLKEYSKLIRFNGSVLFQNQFVVPNMLSKESYSELFDTYYKKNEFRLMESSKALKDIIKLGGKISVGGHGNPLPGIGTHWELWALTYGGLSNYRALEAATMNGAEKIDLQEEIGSIEKGKLADLLVLNSDPIDDIFNSTDILYTIINANIFRADTMEQIYPLEKEIGFWGYESKIVQDNMMNIHIKNNLNDL